MSENQLNSGDLERKAMNRVKWLDVCQWPRHPRGAMGLKRNKINVRANVFLSLYLESVSQWSGQLP